VAVGQGALEDMVTGMEKLFGGVYRGKKVLLTGHTGFKGSWLALWLQKMGAEVTGFSLDDPSDPCHFRLLKLEMESVRGDVRDASRLEAAARRARPDIVFHLAAQALVRRSYALPLETFETNVTGTLNVLEAARREGSARAIVCVTSDKVYENREWAWGYRENDRLGGHDPYSASKACAEIAVSSFRNSFFGLRDYGTRHRTFVATARAGNVIGGGDWAEDRLIPDIVRAAGRKETVTIRSPNATRPWQHVLECLSGYLVVGQRLLEGNVEAARAWNFGPPESGVLTVEEVVTRVKRLWPEFTFSVRPDDSGRHEAFALTLDSSLARASLGWKPVWSDHEQLFSRTIGWYREYLERGAVLTEPDLDGYVRDARGLGLAWAG
jgi:CDP-glucose 4,6-dehydratase